MAHLQFLRILRQHQPENFDLINRASGNVICETCGLELYDHLAREERGEHSVFVGLAVDCEGKVWKL